MKGDIGMANYEKQVEQEAAYPIPISLYNCYRAVRHEKRYYEKQVEQEAAYPIPISLYNCYRTVRHEKSIYPFLTSDLPSLYPPSFRRNDFYTCSPIVGCAEQRAVYAHAPVE